MPAASIPSNLPTRYYRDRTFTVDGVRETVPAGIYTDHSSALVEQVVYDLRHRQGEDRWTHYDISDRLQLGHWRVSYNVGRNFGRRRDGENGRNAEGQLTYRSWNRRPNYRNDPAAPARPGARPDTSVVSGRFGIEVEFNQSLDSTDYYGGSNVRNEAVRLMQQAGINVEHEAYNHTTRRHWKMTTDATVTGGECVSPIMAGDTASLDEVRDVLRAIKAAGGTTRSGVGMHVHHDATGFTTPSARQHLVDVLRWTEIAMSRYVIQDRCNGNTSCGARLMNDREWTSVRSNVVNIMPGGSPSSYHDAGATVDRYRFYNIEAPLRKYGTVEFRALGGTLHAGKVRVWVRMGQAIMAAAAAGHQVPTAISTPENLVEWLTLHDLVGRRTAAKFLSECARRS